MKDYIIDLGLEFELRFRLAVAVTIQLGPKIKRKKMGGAFWSLREPPFFSSSARDPPRLRQLVYGTYLCTIEIYTPIYKMILLNWARINICCNLKLGPAFSLHVG